MSTVNLPRVAPPDHIDPPGRTSQPYGLFSVVVERDDPGLRWRSGVEWEPIGCGPGASIAALCDYDLGPGGEVWGDQLDDQTGVGTLVEGRPIETFGVYDCQAASRPIEEGRARAVAHLLATEERQVEWQLATGGADIVPSLPGADILTSGPVDVVEAVGEIEAALAGLYGSPGVIHAPRRLGALFADRSVAERRGDRLETLGGNYVALGGGYDLAQDDPDPAGTAWIYGTSRPLHWREESPTVHPDDDQLPTRDVNRVRVVARRLHLIAWECVTVAAQVALPSYDPSDA